MRCRRPSGPRLLERWSRTDVANPPRRLLAIAAAPDGARFNEGRCAGSPNSIANPPQVYLWARWRPAGPAARIDLTQPNFVGWRVGGTRVFRNTAPPSSK